MATIVCYGDSNTWGAVPMPSRPELDRFAPGDRWPGVLREKLGPSHTVIEEGLNGRTTVHDDPVDGAHKNGARFLPVVLETHAPIDLVIIKLGTNDLKQRFSVPACDIADGAGVLVDLVKASANKPASAPPKVLLVAPAPLVELTWLKDMFAGGLEKSRHLGAEYRRVAADRGIPFLDAGEVITSSRVDGIHLDKPMQRKLGEAIAAMVPGILAG
ncbi:MAG TPA: SGNH/GDSL hydrolase family protein [Bauldia sp.]|nr:SGNH/GDSL hydrolase family protein [Bauldia sp.]